MPKPKPTVTTTTADNKSNKASKPSKAAKNAKNANASKFTKNAKNNKTNKPKKIIARYILSPSALQTLRDYQNGSRAHVQFVDGYLERLGKQQNAQSPEEGIEVLCLSRRDSGFCGGRRGCSLGISSLL
jgi:UTP-glucose-1-phosphate uridylyltransferase